MKKFNVFMSFVSGNYSVLEIPDGFAPVDEDGVMGRGVEDCFLGTFEANGLDEAIEKAVHR